MSTAFTPAQVAANKLEAQVMGLQNQFAAQVTRLNAQLTNGIAAVGTTPAVAASDLQDALGNSLPTIQAILTALASAVAVS